MALYDTIKRIVGEVLSGLSLPATEIAEIESITPLVIKFDIRYTITEEFIIKTEIFNDRISQISNPLQIGDKVIVQRVQGGQSFLIIDRVV